MWQNVCFGIRKDVVKTSSLPEVAHSDLMELFSVALMGGARYIIVFIDD